MVAVQPIPPSNDEHLHHFEGQEKRLQLHFSFEDPSTSLRSIDRAQWSEMLAAANCSILSAMSNGCCDSYVLSESSLFVYKRGMMVKTCGTTSLLCMLPKVLESTYRMGGTPTRVVFTHSGLMYPTEQCFPHRSFDSEVEYLHRFFPEGEARVLGDTANRTAQHHVFYAEYEQHVRDELDCPTIEVVMTGLARSAMGPFFRVADAAATEDVRTRSGIAALLPVTAIVDEANFEPCGYSANALDGTSFVSIHVTPEDHCSFVSFETSCYSDKSLVDFIQRVAATFRPQHLSAVISNVIPNLGTGLERCSIDGLNLVESNLLESGTAAFYKLSFSAPDATNRCLAGPCSKAPKHALICQAPLRAIHPGPHLDSLLELVGTEFSMRDFVGGGVADASRALLAEHVKERDEPFYLVDLGVVASKYKQWVELLPRVRPHYAVKAAPDPAIVKLLHRLGCGFDCASKAEIDLVKAAGVPSDSIIYANPCKLASHLRFARLRGVRRMTFDNEDELLKIAKEFPAAQVVLRIVTDDSNSICRFSNKFGAELREAPRLIRKAVELGLELVGVSFHVGSGCQDTDSFCDALQRARWVFQQMTDLGVSPWLLDIGGGFPGTDDEAVSFAQIAEVIRPVIDELFEPHVSVISEPGRYFCAASHTLVAKMYARRAVKRQESTVEVDFASAHTTNSVDSVSLSASDEQLVVEEDDKAGYLYYLNDGVYGSFNCTFFDHAVIKDYEVLSPNGDSLDKRPKYKSTVFGPTCDGLDTILTDVCLPLIEVDEWMSFANMGAYTRSAASNFNGFHSHDVYYIRT